MEAVKVTYNLHDLDKISNSIYFLSGTKYHFKNSFDWQNKRYHCALLADKKPVCGILSKDFEMIRSWEDRKKKNILEKMKKTT